MDEFNQLILRGGFCDSWALVSWDATRYRPNDAQYIRDTWMKESLRDMGQPSSCSRFVHLYVNGLYYFTREDSWVVERDNVINNYLPALYNTANSYALIRLLRAENLYPNLDPPVFRINGLSQHGGQTPTGAVLTLTNPNGRGVTYYTLDGSDPRASSGPPPYTGPITLTQSTHIKARILDNGQWSALNEATFVVSAEN